MHRNAGHVDKVLLKLDFRLQNYRPRCHAAGGARSPPRTCVLGLQGPTAATLFGGDVVESGSARGPFGPCALRPHPNLLWSQHLPSLTSASPSSTMWFSPALAATAALHALATAGQALASSLEPSKSEVVVTSPTHPAPVFGVLPDRKLPSCCCDTAIPTARSLTTCGSRRPPCTRRRGFDDKLRACCEAIGGLPLSDSAWRQAYLSELGFGKLGLRGTAQHAPAAYIASITATAASCQLLDPNYHVALSGPSTFCRTARPLPSVKAYRAHLRLLPSLGLAPGCLRVLLNPSA